MIGSKISVAVADAKGNKDVSDETAPVAVYEALEILAAEQKGAKTIEATFSEEITALDKLTVSKNGEELKQAYAAKIADDGLSATITLENRITAGTYTVTLTPADEDPSSATFEGEVAALNSIEFVTDNLIMKDNEYKEGYAYIKGVDQFGDNMSLSSVTVIPGYGHFRSYDATTGKITIGVDDDETNFAIVKEVPVFVTYQNGADTIPANATLKVTTMSYVQELTFGDIYKADGSKVDDDTNPLMIGDLKSKPYVEILDVEDQYGNKLSAKDLNDQVTGNTKVLFVIPDENTTSAYYSTGKFSTITEKDGTVKTILYLAAGGDMPGSMDLIITGASGQSFSKPVTVQDDPYIDVLRVNYPTLYQGTDESDALEFTAVDQYGKEIKDLFNFAPKTTDNDSTLVFNDRNHLTGQITKITAPDKVNWVVKKDNINKKFTVSIKLNPEVQKGDTLVMTAQTAGLKVTPTNLTVGQRTNGESIDTAIGGNLNLDPQNTSFDFNQNVRFLSSNGTTMDRVENEQYPVFLKAASNVSTATYNKVINNVSAEKPGFFWTVSLGREGQVISNTVGGNTTYTIAPTTGYPFDMDGVVKVDELDRANDDNATIIDGDTYKEHKNGTYYVTLYKASKDNSGKLTVAVIDKQSFKLTYSPTKVDNQWQLGTQYTASVKENRNVYAGNKEDGTKDSVTIQVKAYPNIGEPYFVDPKFVRVTGNTSAITCDGATLKVTASAAGSATFSVYVDEDRDGVEAHTTVKVTADASQTATKARKRFQAKAVDRADLNSKVGADFKDDSRKETEWTASTTYTDSYTFTNEADVDGNPDSERFFASEVTIEDGIMTITSGNRLGETLTLAIEDQHGIAMKDAKFYVDGQPYDKFWATTDDGRINLVDGDTVWTNPRAVVGKEVAGYTYTNDTKRTIEVRSKDDSIISYNVITLGTTKWNYTATAETTATTVYNESQLKKAFTEGKDDTVTLGKDITLTGNFGATEIEKDDKLIIPAEYALYINGKTLTVDGKLEISGLVSGGTNAVPAKDGTVQGDGTVTIKDGGTLYVNKATLKKDQTLHVNKGGTLIVTNLGGYVVTAEDIVADTISAGAEITINKGLDISAANGSVPTIEEGAKIIVEAAKGDTAATITLGDVEVAATKDAEDGFVIADPKGEADDAIALKTAIDALNFTGLELKNNTTSDTGLNAAIKALADEVVSASVEDATVTVSDIVTVDEEGVSQLTVAGGTITATITVAKDGYSKDFEDVGIENPKNDDYAAAETAIDALDFSSGLELGTNVTAEPENSVIIGLINAVNGVSAVAADRVAVTTITDSEPTAWSVDGGTAKVTFTISKDGYTGTFENIDLVNPKKT